MLRKFAAVLSGALLAVLVAPGLCTATRAEEAKAPSPAEPQTNVRVTIRLGRMEQGKRNVLKSYDLVVAAGTVGSKLLSGARVPIPTAGSDAAEKGMGNDGATRFVYQNIGFSVDAKVWILGDKKIKLLAELEDSRVKERTGNQPPFVETRQLSINAILSDGAPLEVTRVEGEADQPGFVEIEAKVLR
jgi:hypothetical protein